MKRIQHGRQSGGFSLLDAIVVAGILVVLLAMLLPALKAARRKPCRINCTNNLKQIGLSFRQWALDNGDKFPMQVSITNGGTMELIESGKVFVHFRVLSNELNTPKILFCPWESNPKRRCASRFDSSSPSDTGRPTFTNDNNVSYFVGVDANQTNPAMIVSGDDNFTVTGKIPKPGLLHLWTNSPVAWTAKRHVNIGNVGLADGSVRVSTSQHLRQILSQTGVATNRLAMP